MVEEDRGGGGAMKSTAERDALVCSLELPRDRNAGRMDTTESCRRSVLTESISSISGSGSLADRTWSPKTAGEAEEWFNGGTAGRAVVRREFGESRSRAEEEVTCAFAMVAVVSVEVA
jgi:hypothetical protein